MTLLSSGQLLYFYAVFTAFLVLFAVLFFLIRRARAKKRLSSALGFALYEITLPREGESQKEKTSFQDLVSVMEQFYLGVSSILENRWFGPSSFALELALPAVGEEAVFYAAIPRAKSRLLGKQLQSFFPHARVEEKSEDYNIFNPGGVSVAASLILAENPVLPIRTYKHLDADPLEAIANSFSKLKKEGEGAALQLILSREPSGFAKRLKEALKALREGRAIKLASEGGWGKVIADEFFASKPKEDKSVKKPVDEEILKLVEEKSSFPALGANIRLVASGATEEEAGFILQELASAFNQFSEPRGNSFKLKMPKSRELSNFFYNFSFRLFDPKTAIPLNTRELTSVFHFPSASTSAPKIKFLKARDASAPAGLPQDGMLLGENTYRGETAPVRISKDDRRRHFYIIGQTGTGKSTLIQNMVKEDIEKGEGLCVIDPHGDMVEKILGYIPENRAEDTVYFDPADTSRPMGLNFLEYDPAYPEQKTFIVNELLEIFRKLYADVPEALGPMFETYFRNATLLVMEDPSSGNTLLEIERVMAEKSFRDLKLSRSKNPVINAFWRDVAEKAGGEAAIANMVPYITSKFDTFLTNEYMRPILLQERSSIKFKEIIDGGKILLVNLSKGRIGETNASLLGLIIVGKLLMAALSRVSVAEEERRDFYLYLDEFQNVTTPSIATILSEARKYRLDLILAHQFIGQLSEEIKRAVFGNVGSIASFRIGADDAEFVQKQFEPVFSAHDLMNIENFNAYLKLLVRGETARPFNIRIMPPRAGDSSRAQAAKELSKLKYGRPREEIEAEISEKYKK